MTVEEIIKILNDFVPFADNDPSNDNESFFRDLMKLWVKTTNKQRAVPAIFQLMERYPHADFGSPGPIVHSFEAEGNRLYGGELQKSLLRKPTPLTIWMYNRIINTQEDRSIIKGHIERLELFGKHPFIDSETKQITEQFIDHQRDRL